MSRITFVVSRDQVTLATGLREGRVNPNVEIVVDRRHGDRRRRNDPIAFPDRRVDQRRTRLNDRELELIGIAAIVSPQ